MRELVGRVRNVVLMNVYLDLGNPGELGFWVGGVYEPSEGNGEVSLRATWERGGRILSQLGGFQVTRRGLERGARGNEKQGECAVYIVSCIHVHNGMLVEIE